MGSFVGRDRELAYLGHCFSAAQGGSGSALLISSPRGVGKTRLLREFKKTVEAAGAQFVLGGNLHRDQAPHAPFREGLGDVFLRRLFAPAPAPARVVAIEDIQWADDATLELIGRVCRQVSDLPLLLVLTLQTPVFESATWPPALENLLPTIPDVLRLETLAAPHVRTLLNDAAKASFALSPDVMEKIERCSGGNPLYLEEMLADACDARPARNSSLVPETLRSLVFKEMAAIPHASRQIVSVASALGDSFDDRLLASVSKSSGRAVALALQAAFERRLLHCVEGSANRYAFAQPLFREALYESLTPSMRRVAHGAAAIALEGGSQGPGHWGALADHWYASDRRDRSLDVLGRAAEEAEVAGDYAGAARFYRRMLEFAPEKSGERARLCRKVGDALFHAGSVARARPFLEEAAAFHAESGEPQKAAELLRYLAVALWQDGSGPAALAVIESALAHLSDCPDSAATCHLLVSAAGICDLLGMRERSFDLLERAQAMRCRKPRALRIRYHNVRGCCLSRLQRFSDAIVEFDAALVLLEKQPDRELKMAILRNASATQRSAGRFREAETRAREALDFVRKQRSGLLFENTFMLVHAALLAMCGDLAEAASLIELVAAAQPTSGLSRLELLAFGLPIGLAVDRQDLIDACFDESLVEMAFAANVTSGTGMVVNAVSRLKYALGDVKYARALLNRGLQVVDSVEFVEPMMLAVAEYGQKSDFKRARALLAEPAESLARPAFLALFDAFVAQRSGDVRESQRRALEAAVAFEHLGAPQFAARALELAGRQKSALEAYRAIGAVRDSKRLSGVFAGRGTKTRSGVLTGRQLEIGRFIAAGRCNRDIARDLRISAKTLESHLTAMYRRIGVSSRSGIAAYIAKRSEQEMP
jgi:DNA-binding NarL/FixJ family response regulator